MLEAAGTSATRRGHPLERLYRDARCGSLQPATSDVCADWLGRRRARRRPGPRRVGAPMVSRTAAAVVGRGSVAGAVIAGSGTAVAQEELWEASSPATTPARPGAGQADLRQLGRPPGTAVVNPLVEDVSAWPTGERMQRYLAEALPLGKEAVGRALDRRPASPPATSACSSVCSCTGYVTPGLDILLARDLGMAAGRAAALRRSHGLLRGAARAGRGARLRRRPGPAGACCSASS